MSMILKYGPNLHASSIGNSQEIFFFLYYHINRAKSVQCMVPKFLLSKGENAMAPTSKDAKYEMCGTLSQIKVFKPQMIT